MIGRALLLVMAAAMLCPAEDIVTLHTRRQNLVRLTLDDGIADLEWISGGAFRFTRSWDRNAPASPPFSMRKIEFTLQESGDALQFATSHLRVRIAKNGLRLFVHTKDGKPLLTEAAPVRREGSTAVLERELQADEFFFGLGARPGPITLRKVRVDSDYPFLLSSLGHGQYFSRAGSYSFDLGAGTGDKCRISAPVGQSIEYFFYYGPAIKDVLDEHIEHAGLLDVRRDTDFGILKSRPRDTEKLSGGELAPVVRAVINSSLSGIRLPTLDLSEMKAQAHLLLPLATTLPVIFRSGSQPEGSLLPLRDRLVPYIQTYLQEARDRAFPIIRALPMQFPKDAKTWEVDDQFMLGDELLVAPRLSSAANRSIYLPMGIWTDLRTNQTHNGRQTIEIQVEDGELPLFVKNGNILPLAGERREDPLVLHYFPKLGAEFFLYETNLGDISQFHAAPAADFMRVEVESKVNRIYEWIIHHVTAPRSVRQGDAAFARAASAQDMKPGTWWFDERAGNLHIRMEGPAGEDRIVNIGF